MMVHGTMFRGAILCFVIWTLLLVPMTASASQLLYRARMDFEVGESPNCVAAGDLDGDGIPDLAVANVLSDDVSVLLGIGDGTFQPAADHPVGELPRSLVIRDFDGDGDQDLAVTSYDPEPIWILLGNGDGTFITAGQYSSGPSNPLFLSAGDVDGDGFDDLVGACPSEDSISLLLGNGDGSFGSAESYSVGINPYSVSIGDLNGDDIPDLAVTNSWATLSLLFGNGDGTFQDAVNSDIGEGCIGVAINDMDEDGAADLIVSGGGAVSILLGHGNGSFDDPLVFDAGGTSFAPGVGDLNGDGHLDVVVSNSTDNKVFVLLGTGDGGLQPPEHFWVYYSPRYVELSDLDNDGDLDLVTSNSGDVLSSDPEDSVSVLLGSGDGTFNSAPDYWAGDYPNSIAIGDLNNDSHPDAVVTSAYYDYYAAFSQVSILLGAGDGTFESAMQFDLGEDVYATGIATADLDGDGNLDLAVTHYSGYYIPSVGVFILPGNGDGTFGAAMHYETSDSAYSVVIGDLNGDGHPDLALACLNASVAVLLGNGDGTFSTPDYYLADSFVYNLAIGDMNGDVNPDLVVGVEYSRVAILLGNGDGSFLHDGSYGTDGYPNSLVTLDLDQDGHQDVVAASGATDNVSVLLGNGDGSLLGVGQYPVGYGLRAVTAGDLDGDGIPDLAAVHDAKVLVLLGLGDGTFRNLVNFGCAGWPRAVAISDLDSDGDPDLVVPSGRHDTISVLINLDPDPEGSSRIVTGPGPGYENSPLVRLFPPVQNPEMEFEFQAYGAPHYGVNLACGDLGGVQQDVIITGPGPGEMYGPHVRGWSADGTPMAGVNFLAYGTPRWGVNVSAGDLDGDGFDEIITGAGPGAVFGPHVRGWNVDGGTASSMSGVSYFAYGTNKWGVNVAAGDIDGDGFDEIITGAGPGAVFGPHVRGWDYDGSGPIAPIQWVSYLAYGTNQWGVNAACGDLDGDGLDEIITGPGPSLAFGSHVRGWKCDGGMVVPMPTVSFFAYPDALYGAVVSAFDIDGDGIDEILTMPGPDPSRPARVRGWNIDGGPVTAMENVDFYPYADEMRYGGKVCGGWFEER